MKFDVKLDEELFREKFLRDLKSIIYDPLLIESDEAKSLQMKMRVAVERFLDNHPHRLWRMISPPEPRLPLGKWFEQVFAVALRIAFPLSDVLHSVRDKDGGELDFVVIDFKRVIHVECSMKFFLHRESLGVGLESFVGPGGQDRLDLKLDKMKRVQLQRKIPSSLVEGCDVARILWMGGRIHFESNVSFPSLSPEINKHCLKGFWLPRTRFCQREFFDHSRLVHLPRQWWMTPLSGLSPDFLNRFDDLNLSVDMDQAALIAVVTEDQYGMRELDRGFITPN